MRMKSLLDNNFPTLQIGSHDCFRLTIKQLYKFRAFYSFVPDFISLQWNYSLLFMSMCFLWIIGISLLNLNTSIVVSLDLSIPGVLSLELRRLPRGGSNLHPAIFTVCKIVFYDTETRRINLNSFYCMFNCERRQWLSSKYENKRTNVYFPLNIGTHHPHTCHMIAKLVHKSYCLIQSTPAQTIYLFILVQFI